jgi:hypothetical protein
MTPHPTSTIHPPELDRRVILGACPSGEDKQLLVTAVSVAGDLDLVVRVFESAAMAERVEHWFNRRYGSNRRDVALGPAPSAGYGSGAIGRSRLPQGWNRPGRARAACGSGRVPGAARLRRGPAGRRDRPAPAGRLNPYRNFSQLLIDLMSI